MNIKHIKVLGGDHLKLPLQRLIYLVDAAQRGLLGAGDQVSSNTDHVDLILLQAQRPERQQSEGSSSTKPLPRSHLLVELHQALLADVVGPHDDQRIKGRDGKSEEITQTDKGELRKERPARAGAVAQTAPTNPDRAIIKTGEHRDGGRTKTLRIEEKSQQNRKNLLKFQCLSKSDSLLPAEAEDAAHVQRLPAEVAAVQAQPQRLEAQFAQR